MDTPTPENPSIPSPAPLAVVHGAEGPSPVFVGNGLLARAGEIAARAVPGRRALAVTDSNVAPLHLAPLLASLRASGFAAESLEIHAGEASKNLRTLETLWNALHAAGITRGDLVVALGGGVVGDLAGFAAATWLRGVSVLQAPTSLLAFVDSSIGGKTAIDLPFGKNLVGAFHQPAAVVGDPLVLRTLPPREFAQGMAEVVKTACILDADLLAFLRERAGRPFSDADTERVIAACAAAKAGVVNRDEREGGLRMILNFGHTVGHAVEKVLGYGTVPHGEAVAVGMVAAARFGERLGKTPPGTASELVGLLRRLDLPVCAADLPDGGACTPDALADAMLSDKKKLGAEIRFVLLEGWGHATVVPILPADARAALPAIL
jgi:3-dehydroquinate synthase